jgi:hypothetical protein
MVTQTFYESLGANALLGVCYLLYKVVDRCLHSRCKFTKDGGLDFDLGDPEPCPASDMNKLADILKQRSLLYRV